MIKDYFLSHNEALFNDFVLDGYGLTRRWSPQPGRRAVADHVRRHGGAIDDRRAAEVVEPYIGDDEVFMATYGDGLTDVDLPALVRTFETSGKMVMFALVRPHFLAHLVEADAEGTVHDVRAMDTSGIRINGGFFVLRRKIFDWIEPGEELVEETFAKLIPRGEIGGYIHDGFLGRWTPSRTGSGSKGCSTPAGRRGSASGSMRQSLQSDDLRVWPPRPAGRFDACSRSALIRTISRSAAQGRSRPSCAQRRSSLFTGSSSRDPAIVAPKRAEAPKRYSTRPAPPPSRSSPFATGTCRTWPPR